MTQVVRTGEELCLPRDLELRLSCSILSNQSKDLPVMESQRGAQVPLAVQKAT